MSPIRPWLVCMCQDVCKVLLVVVLCFVLAAECSRHRAAQAIHV